MKRTLKIAFLLCLISLVSVILFTACYAPVNNGEQTEPSYNEQTTPEDTTAAPHVHTEEIDPAVAPTCVNTGLTEGKHCAGCGEVLVAQEVIDALGHTEVIDEPIAPTCTATGLTGGKHCSVCNETLIAQTTIDALNHDIENHNAQAPTCTEIGWAAYVTCKREDCTYTTYIEEKATGHSYTHVVTAPTCTVDGYTTHTCHCGDSYADTPVKALGHTVVVDAAVDPDCTNTGLTEGKHCSVCNEVLVAQNIVDALGHTVVIDKAIAPDCTNTGLTEGKHCSVCNDVLVAQAAVEALGHKDENTDGYCDICDTMVNVRIAFSGTYYNIYRESIYVDTEYFKVDFGDCIVVFTYEISDAINTLTATYHSIICDDAELKVELEEEYEGAVFVYSFLLNKEHFALWEEGDEDLTEYYYRLDFLPPCEHDIITIPGKEPTCSEQGYTDHIYCDICGEIFIELETIEKIDHTYDQMVANNNYLKTEATVDSPAIYYKSCVCGAKGEETFTHGDVLTIPLSSVTLNKNEITMEVESTETLIATLNPSDTTEKIIWVSSNESVVKVVNGTLIAIGKGEAIVTVETKEYIFAYCIVKVIIPVENVTLDKSAAEIYIGQPFALNASVFPDHADEKKLQWTSSNEAVATVNANGVITAKSAGTVVITATAPNGVAATCTLTVKAGELKFTATEDSSFYYVSGYEGYETHIEIPNLHDGLRVIRIAESAFKGNTTIESITLPNSIQTIDAHAFEGCTSLKTITIPDSVTIINAYTFADCTALSSILLNKNLTSIGEYAFNGCTALTEISIKATGAKLTTIGSYAFANCTALKSFDISEYATLLETIGDHAFSHCTALESVILSDTVKIISTSAFEYCSALASIDLGESLVTIADKAFDYCIALVKIEMPDTVTTLGNMAFRHNDKLSEVIFSATLVRIGNAAFQYCISIEELLLPENITQLGNSAFSYCEGIKYLGILGNITVWGDSTFYECGNIEVLYIASKTNSEIPENNYIFYSAGQKSDGIVLALGVGAVIPEGLFEPVEDIENYPRIIGIMAEDGSTSFNAFSEKNNLPYLVAIAMPDSMVNLTYGIFNNSPWWEAQEKGVVYIDNYFYGYKCECRAATPTEIWVENYLASTCTEEGFYQNVCKCLVCEYEVLRQDIVIPALGHSPLSAVVENYIAPDCVTDGNYDSVVYCGRCEAELSREEVIVPALDHDYIDHEAQAVTCLVIGWDAYQTCGRCDYTTYEEIPALGHSPLDAVIENNVDPDCLNDGYYETVVYCDRCDDELSRVGTVVDALGHSPLSAVVENYIAPDCVTDGNYDSVVYCGRCEAELSREEVIVPALDHDYIDHEAQEVTCLEIGWDAYQTCGRCDYTTYEEIAALGHSPLDAIIENSANPDCLNDGYYETVVYCDRCDAELSRVGTVVDALGHSPIDAVIENNVDPDCLNDGYYETVVYCDRCDAELSRVGTGVDALGHSPKSAKENIVEFSCTVDGSYDYVVYCDTCNLELSREHKVVSAAAHRVANDKCSVCGRLNSSAGLQFTLNSDGKGYTLIGSGTFNGTVLVIDLYNNLPVTSIKENLSFGKQITSLTIGDDVTSIGNSSFYGCQSLEEIYFNATAMNDLSSYNKVFSYAGNSGNGIAVVIGKNVTKIPAYIFCPDSNSSQLPKIISVEFEEGSVCKSIRSHAFSYCRNLTSVTIPEGVTSIGDNAFYFCTSLTSVTIGDSVTSIGSSAFEYCTSLTNVTIGDSVTSIGSSAFEDCTALEEIYFNATAMNDFSYDYNNWVFANAGTRGNGIKVVIGKNVTKIPAYLFNPSAHSVNRTPLKVTSVEFEDGSICESIGKGAFSNCTNLTSLVIGDSVTSIGKYAFSYCTALEEIYFNATAMNDLSSANGVFSGAGKNGNGIKVVIGKNVTKIPAYLFSPISNASDSPKIISVEFEEGSVCKSIGDNAFRYCTSLTSVTIPDGVTSIGDYAFYNCASLTSVTIGDGVTSIGSDAFYRCSSLTSVYITDITKWCEISWGNSSANPMYYADNLYLNGELVTNLIIPDGVTSIGSDAFYGCTGLTSVTIGDGVTSIGSNAFYGCTALEEIYFNATEMNGLSSNNYAFYNAGKNGNGIKVVIGKNVTNVPNYLFYPCSSSSSYLPKIVSVEFEEGSACTSIGSYAFYGCSSLTSIVIPKGVTSIGDAAFYNCTKLVEVINHSNLAIKARLSGYGYVAYYAKEVHNGTTKIVQQNGYLFYTYGGANYLLGYVGTDTALTLPDNYNGQEYTIVDYAFYNCTRLSSMTIGNSVTSIGSYAFYNCTSLTSVTIGDSVTSIGDDAFYNCSSLTSVNYLGTIAQWCNISFGDSSANPLYYAKNLYLNGDLVTELVIPDSVTSIGSYAFYNCASLTSVTVPDSVTSIGDHAFRGCTSLTSIVISDSVTSIGSYAFSSCSNLTSIVISDNVTSISYYAFYNCDSLTIFCEVTSKPRGWDLSWNDSNCPVVWGYTGSKGTTDSGFKWASTVDGIIIYGYSGVETDIVVPETINEIQIVAIASSAFRRNTTVLSITIPSSITAIGTHAFSGCTGLTSVTIGDGVTSIGSYAFRGCSSLTSIVIPDNVTSIGSYAFEDCTALTSVTIGNGVTSIGGSAFEDCTALTSVTFGDNVTSIGSYAFRGCSSLTSIVIPDNVTSIGDYAFKACTGLTSVTFGDNVTSIAYSAFRGCTGLTSIVVQEGNTKYHSAGNCLIETESKTLIFGCKNSVIPTDGSVTSIGGSAFYDCTGLTSIEIPDSVTSIGSYAFYNCTSLTSVTIGNGVTSIGRYAFYNCSSLTTIYYGGTAEDWARISFDSYGNSDIKNATRYYYSETQPTDTTNKYWHYVDGVPTKW